MKSLGAMLREERERQGQTLEEISTRTRIRLTYLEAIEKDRLDTIPGGFFSRSFVRQYGRVLGISPDEIERQLSNVTVPPTETVRVDKIYEDYRPTSSLHTRPSVFITPEEEAESEILHEAAFLKESRSGTFWMVLALFLIVGSGVLLTWQREPEMFENVFAKTSGTESQKPAPVESTVAAVVPEQKQAEPTPAESADHHSSPVEVAVVAMEKSWVRLIVDGERIFGGVMEPGETRTLNGEQSAVVFTGNAGGLDFTYNGKSIGTAGPKGQVRTVVFSAENWEVRSQQAKKIETTDSVESDVVRAP